MTALLPGRQRALAGAFGSATAIGGGLVVLAASAKILRIDEFEAGDGGRDSRARDCQIMLGPNR